jgi:hypothetical protein
MIWTAKSRTSKRLSILSDSHAPTIIIGPSSSRLFLASHSADAASTRASLTRRPHCHGPEDALERRRSMVRLILGSLKQNNCTPSQSLAYLLRTTCGHCFALRCSRESSLEEGDDDTSDFASGREIRRASPPIITHPHALSDCFHDISKALLWQIARIPNFYAVHCRFPNDRSSDTSHDVEHSRSFKRGVPLRVVPVRRMSDAMHDRHAVPDGRLKAS